ncbi:uncharacterized protein [Hoplias malabaricus]|uniref:uncharacterized protein isoform X2 n=1 Tax=Hoplias malabaricus TaxID=27720 RepID=UPI003461CD25
MFILLLSLDEILEAKIYGNKTVKEGGKLQITCSTFGSNPDHNLVWIYLCRNGTGINRKNSRDSDIEFSIDDITINYTGNYSCAFSKKKLEPQDIKVNAANSIFITVNDSVVPGKITSPETSVKEGSDVEFECTSSKLPESDTNNHIYAYLCKNGTVLQVNLWDIKNNMSIFMIKHIKMEDAARYFCVLMGNLQPVPKRTIYGINEVKLHVSENVSDIKIIVVICCSILLLLLLFSLCLWRLIEKGYFKFHGERSTENGAESRREILNLDETDNKPSTAAEWDEFSDDSEAGVSRSVENSIKRAIIALGRVLQNLLLMIHITVMEYSAGNQA